MTLDSPIFVTRPTLPTLDEFIPYLQEIWHSRVLTNNGPFHQQLEDRLAKYLGVQHLSLFTNGSIALLTALRALDVSGEVITTPFSFAATAHSLSWAGLTPVFVDIDPVTFNLDPTLIEKAITSRTSAILPVHCYGHPCDVTHIQTIAQNHGLSVIYDAAHAFGVSVNNRSVLAYGDLSVLSFHATKVFHTFEGGAVVSSDKEMKLKVDRLKNFGFIDEITVGDTGLNGKMSELHAAFGLVMLDRIDAAIRCRQAIAADYRRLLDGINGIKVPPAGLETESNASYMPIVITDSYPLSRDAIYEHLKYHNIFTRRYFFPLLIDMPAYQHLPSSHRALLPRAAYAAERVLCLPLYPDLPESVPQTIAQYLRAHSTALPTAAELYAPNNWCATMSSD